MNNKSKIYIVRDISINNYISDFPKIVHHIHEGIISLNLSDKIKRADQIVIKVNICDARTPETGAITDPKFLDATLEVLRKHLDYSKNIYIVESDSTVVLADKFFEWFGYKQVADKWNSKVLNLSSLAKDPTQTETIYSPDNKFKITILKLLKDSLIINIPKIKVNAITMITCCLKNMFGCLPEQNKSIYHPHINKVISLVNKNYSNQICIVDGIITQIGYQGPAFGIPYRANLIMVGNDPVAIDALSSRIFNIPPSLVGHIKLSYKHKVGNTSYELIGPDKDINVKLNAQLFKLILYRIGLTLRQIAITRGRKK